MTISIYGHPFNFPAMSYLFYDTPIQSGYTWEYDNSANIITYSYSVNSSLEIRQIHDQAFFELESFLSVDFVQISDEQYISSETNYANYVQRGNDISADIRIVYQSDGSRNGGFNSMWVWSTDSDGDIEDIDSVNHIWTAQHFTILHEIGHSLNLKHTSPYQLPTNDPFLIEFEQNNNYTIMHYDDRSSGYIDNSHGEWDFRHYQLYDVYTLQQRFGSNLSTYAGNSIHSSNSLQMDQWLRVLWDASGIDIIDMSIQYRNQQIDLGEGKFSNIGNLNGNNPFGHNLAIAFGAQIENANGGSGADTITGNAVANILDGGFGSDTLSGLAGDDTLIGGSGHSNILIGGTGNDVYVVSASGDVTTEASGEGTDEVRTSLSVLALSANVEILTYLGTSQFAGLGNDLDNLITGGTKADELYGYAGNDTLNDGGGLSTSADSLLGGAGNDLYIVGVRNSSTIEYVGEGTDEVRTIFSIYALQANIENLTYSDNATHSAGVGNALSNVIRGGTGTDDLFGREGNDTLFGGTGSANTLLGQQGDDIYVVEAVGDSLIENAGEGIDTVETSLSSFSLRDHVENLTYTGAGNFVGIGGTDGNLIVGGNGTDFLSGLDGADILIGGNGVDELLGGNGADQFRYSGQTGMDRIYDFTSGQDKIALSSVYYTPTAIISFSQGALPSPTNGNSTFLYNSSNGILSYDDDGNGAGAAVQIAQLNAGLTLASTDFIFY